MSNILEKKLKEYKVSVIVPIYNVERYLQECLDSLLRQRFDGLQVIMVDDRSNDKSGEIAASYAARYDNFFLLTHKENSGLSVSRNNGIKIATGKYVLFLDSDDYLEDDSIKKLYSICEENNLDVLKFDYLTYIDEYSRPIECEIEIPISTDSNINDGFKFLSKLGKNPSCCLIFIRREVIENNELSFLEGVIHEDNLFFVELLICSKRVKSVPLGLYYRRIRSDSIMKKRNYYRVWMSYILMTEELIRFADFRGATVKNEIAWMLENAYRAIIYFEPKEMNKLPRKLVSSQKRLAIKYAKNIRKKALLVLLFPEVFNIGKRIINRLSEIS